MKNRKTLRRFTVLFIFFLSNLWFLSSDPAKKRSSKDSQTEINLISILPFHFPMEATLIPGYSTPQLSLGTELLFQKTPFLGFQSNQSLTATGQSFDVPLTVSEEIQLANPGRFYPQLAGDPIANPLIRRNPGVILLFSYQKFTFQMGFDWIQVPNFSFHQFGEFRRSTLGLSYTIPQTPFPDHIKTNLNMSFQAVESAVWEDRLRKQSPAFFQKQYYVTPGFSIGSKKGWALEGMVKMPIPSNHDLITEEYVRNEIQGRLGLKWNLPDQIKP